MIQLVKIFIIVEIISDSILKKSSGILQDFYEIDVIEEIKEIIAENNKRQPILNEQLFGKLHNDSVVIVVQVNITNTK